jgi:hypothetical protein
MERVAKPVVKSVFNARRMVGETALLAAMLLTASWLFRS